MDLKKEHDVTNVHDDNVENTISTDNSQNTNFQLSKYIDITGRGFKTPEVLMSAILAPLKLPPTRNISVDSSQIELRVEYLLESTNYIYGICDDPYTLGKISCSDVLNKLYASGVVECDGILLTIGVSTKIPKEERLSVISMITNGFRDCATECETKVNSINCIYNPWIMVGGTATTATHKGLCFMSYKARDGDLLVLTKPLGTQVAINVKTWLNKPEFWEVAKNFITEEDVNYAYEIALASMSLPSYNVALCMQKYDIHGVTHIGRDGLLGHAKVLLQNMENNMSFNIYNLPIIDKLAPVSKAFGEMFHLLDGFCSETSGGLLLCMPKDHAQAFVKDLQSNYNQGWIIGTVRADENKTITLISQPYIVNVDLNIPRDKPDS